MSEFPATPESLQTRLADLLANHAEWFCTVSEGKTLPLRSDEIDFTTSRQRLLLTCWTETGSKTWRVSSCDWDGEKILIKAARRMGAECDTIELVPRASAAAIALTVKAARQARCEKLADLALTLQTAAKLERCSLSPGARRGQPGRYARVVFRQKHQRIAMTGSVTASKVSDVDAFLSAALIWFNRVSERVRSPYIQQLWLTVESGLVKSTIQRVSLLRDALQVAISVYEVDPHLTILKPIEIPKRAEIWKRRLARFPPMPEVEANEITDRLRQIAPEAIDLVNAKYGQTLRYFGLPFARFRRVMGQDRLWFGLDGSRRRLLDQTTEIELTNLIADLKEHRSAQAHDRRHALYRNAAEAWLESLLRRDITQLDPGLIIAPLHAQFRTARGGVISVRPIDLLALRQDGRLAVIELKVSEDREHVLQGLDYWQRVEAHRRRGHVSRARIFGARKIKDEPPLVYLVAPTLRVHPAFNSLARSIAPDIEIYRFDINEDWRAGVKVMRRLRVN